ncbi:uncharacterized protein [Watersipora subatra]|uniref:uncharacterized protein n=1 Tax=Watersipora subatra TaxID=2589382 RepID=UPI00355B8663
MGGRQSAYSNIHTGASNSDWLPSSSCQRHLRVLRLDDACEVEIAANSYFNINYRPTLQTLFIDRDTILYRSFGCNWQGNQLPKGIFDILQKSCSTLKSLKFSNLPNGCRVCVYDLFSKLRLHEYKRLEELSLSRIYKDECYIRFGEDLLFPVSLTQLTLDGLGLVAVPLVICTLKSLTHLSLANNIITQISILVDREDADLSRLIDFNIAENLLSVIPKNIERLLNLKVLNISHNCLKKSIPESIKNLSNLTALSLQWNRLESVPIDSLSELKYLHLLNLSYNKLKIVDNRICFLPSLKVLNLSGNDGLSFHDTSTPSHDSKLQELNISSTAMNLLPSFFSSLSRLRVLDCQNNEVTNIDTILTLPMIERANFKQNGLRDCSWLLRQLQSRDVKLTWLDLTDNELSHEQGEGEINIRNTVVLLKSCEDYLPQLITTRRFSPKTPMKQEDFCWLCR